VIFPRAGGEKDSNMSEDNLLTRREFTVESALAILSAATITINGCGSDDDNSNPTTNPTPQSSNRMGTVSANHGHVAEVTSAQITARNTISVNIMGQATHPHTIDLTGAQLTTISNNGQVVVTSTTDQAHNHIVTFN
jgi:hypothetical protein